MKDDTEYKVCYVNEETGETVPFNHCIPVRFNQEQAELFIKNTNFDRWYGGGNPLPKYWQMKAIKVEPWPELSNLCCVCQMNPVDTAAGFDTCEICGGRI